ncbi:cytochrome B [Pelagibius litoralis]|uniref:Cytochrome B n=1 Tax=Pelagibius litoralis TaxID=374515 RepID=A0A967EYW4_9PROT|nr:cytochrome b561 domain-containing protein [Pelagibius litoralis]NIA69966.1 cytochrome B [Pelagibius litoralis]
MDPLILHALLMLVAWLVLAPLGILLARFFKITPRQDWPRQLDNRFWWYGHLICMYGAVGLAGLAVWTAVSTTGGFELSLHAAFGSMAVGLAVLQVLSGWLRGSKGGPTDRRAARNDPSTWRGDHYDMTARRIAFEAWHKVAGYGVLLLALAAAASGLELLGWLQPFLAWLVALPLLFLLVYGVLQRAGFAKDTYRAIWGPDEAHPGNRRGPGRR